jgi:hypothetical protein
MVFAVSATSIWLLFWPAPVVVSVCIICDRTYCMYFDLHKYAIYTARTACTLTCSVVQDKEEFHQGEHILSENKILCKYLRS